MTQEEFNKRIDKIKINCLNDLAGEKVTEFEKKMAINYAIASTFHFCVQYPELAKEYADKQIAKTTMD